MGARGVDHRWQCGSGHSDRGHRRREERRGRRRHRWWYWRLDLRSGDAKQRVDAGCAPASVLLAGWVLPSAGCTTVKRLTTSPRRLHRTLGPAEAAFRSRSKVTSALPRTLYEAGATSTLGRQRSWIHGGPSDRTSHETTLAGCGGTRT